jgi:EmrB/QacA subfamily drug resistance transporter
VALVDTLLQERPPVYRPRGDSAFWYSVGVVCIGAFMGQLDASIVSLALPTLETSFHQSVAAVSWVAVAYLLTLATLVAVFGRLADMYGRKMFYTFGFVVFIVGSAACGVAPSLLLLTLARVLQGIGAAMLQANSVAIITAVAPKDRLGRAIGVQGAAQALGLSVGPALGGLLISSLGWRWIFYINVPAGLIGAVLGWLVLPITQYQRTKEPFDWTGLALFTPAMVVLMLALTFGQRLGWLSAEILVLLATGILMGALFVLNEHRKVHPLLDLSLFRNLTFSTGITAGFLSYTVTFGAFFIVPFFLERVRHHNPATTGLLLMPVPVVLSLMAPLGGWLTDRFGPRLPTGIGMTSATVAFVLLGLTHRQTHYLFIGLELALLGLGLGLFTPPNNSAIMRSAPANRLGVAGGLLNMTRSMGTAFGVAATGAVLAWQLAALGYSSAHTAGVPAHILAVAFRHTLWFLAALSALALLIALARHNNGVTHQEIRDARSL